MSMHEFEDLVEASVRTLAVSGRSAPELRSRYWNLYEFQGLWDTGFTHFRVMDLLLAARFSYRLPITEHPDYDAHRPYFDGLDEFVFICPPGVECGADGGYYQRPYLYFDAGSPLWSRMVALGRLTGPDAEPPQPIDATRLAYDVATVAERSGDRELVAMWYRLLAYDLAFRAEPAELVANPILGRLRAIVRRTDAMSIPMDYGALVDPDPETLAELPALAWWWNLDAPDSGWPPALNDRPGAAALPGPPSPHSDRPL